MTRDTPFFTLLGPSYFFHNHQAPCCLLLPQYPAEISLSLLGNHRLAGIFNNSFAPFITPLAQVSTLDESKCLLSACLQPGSWALLKKSPTKQSGSTMNECHQPWRDPPHCLEILLYFSSWLTFLLFTKTIAIPFHFLQTFPALPY